MTHRYLISVAAAALIAGTGFANAQGAGHDSPAAGSRAQQSAPSSERGGSSATTPMNRNDASESKGGADSGMKSSQSDDKMQRGSGNNQRAQDTGDKSKSMS